MTSFQEAFAASDTCPDERAAGVISGSDPYRELELYLEKVNEEIGEVFEKWNDLSGRPTVTVKPRYEEVSKCGALNRKYYLEDSVDVDKENDLSFAKRFSSLPNRRSRRSFETCLNAWSENLLAEFDTLIRNNAPSNPVGGVDDDYDEVAGDSDDESMRMKYRVNRREDFEILSSSSPSSSEHSSSGSSGGDNTRLTFPHVFRTDRGNQRPHVASVHNKSDPLLVNVKIYPSEKPKVPEMRNAGCEHENSHHMYNTSNKYCTSQIHHKSKQTVTDAGTQTSPTDSRSSSFTWISDCSEDDHSSTASSTEDSRRLGDSSSDSTPTKDEPESGIGTASPPRHNKYNKSSGIQKNGRKEIWEKLRRRQNGKLESATRKSISSHSVVDHCSSNVGNAESSSDPDLTIFRVPRPKCLQLASCSLSPESSRETLPSPSATSLTLGLELVDVMNRELAGKSSSVPLLMKRGLPSNRCNGVNKVSRQSTKYHSEKLLIEIEAAEACKWLRAAGFPQYAQMYEDKQFPIDLNAVQKDHQFLDPDSLQSLFRRFQTLNKCANMKVELVPTKLNQNDESDSEAECALSEYWSFQRESGRWSRKRDLFEVTSPTTDVPETCENLTAVTRHNTLPPLVLSQPESEIPVSRFRRSGSERLRSGAKAFLRRVESLKSRRRKQKNREGVVISEPQIVDITSMEARIKELNCVDVTPPESPLNSENNNDSVSRYLSQPKNEFSAFSDSEVTVRQSFSDDVNNSSKVLLDITDLSRRQSRRSSRSDSQDSRTFSLKSSSFRKKDENSDAIANTEGDAAMRQKSSTSVIRWHSFQRHLVRPSSSNGQSLNSLAVGQMVVLRKLALLKLTALMERYCPSHRSAGWNWELPKFIRKTKVPDFKDKNVFGVPLLANVQQTGHVLPAYICEALEWLRMNALDQVGIFRKPGVKSRINKLKFMASIKNAKISFDNQQPFDVADMVKQYFRELPDALLTNKLSETYVTIFQYVPENLRKEAVQCALILLPDEHREALYILIDFLREVAEHSYDNQMTASNLAMCLAPSLFYWTHLSGGHQVRRSSSVSPKRLHKSGTFPDVKELGQNKAAHECIHYLIKNYQNLFMISEDVMEQCHFSYMDVSVPVSLDELGEELQQDWRGYMNMCCTALQKEIKEKNRGWIILTNWEDVEIAFKKVRDGHPLRLWRVCTEVEAPPKELLYRILRERRVWDWSFIQSKVVLRLDSHAELFHYVTSDIGPLPSKDFCVIRSWRTDLSKGGCIVVETSVEHTDAVVGPNSVRGIVLASRYLIEPCGSGKSRILHLSRVDIKGRCSDWYNKCYGHICAQYLLRIRNSFQRTTEGPESKV